MHPRPASRVFSGLPLAISSTPLTTNPPYFHWAPNLFSWHLTVIPLGSCSLALFCDSESCLVATCCHLLILPVWQLQVSIHNPCFIQYSFSPSSISSVTWMSYQNAVAYQHFQFGWGGNCSFFKVQLHVAEKQQASAWSLLGTSGKAKFF
jgi:hypothetical protein